MNDNQAGDQQPLFQKIDEQERIYSPDTVPGTGDMPAHEVDADSPASGRAFGSSENDVTGTQSFGRQAAGNDNDGVLVALPPAGGGVGAPNVGANGPLIAPVVLPDNQRDDNESERSR